MDEEKEKKHRTILSPVKWAGRKLEAMTHAFSSAAHNERKEKRKERKEAKEAQKKLDDACPDCQDDDGYAGGYSNSYYPVFIPRPVIYGGFGGGGATSSGGFGHCGVGGHGSCGG